MDGNQVQSAIQTVMMIAGQVIDDLQVAAISFGSSVRRWPGTLDVDPQTQQHQSLKGWSAMPSAPNLEALHQWLQSNRDSSSTNMLDAINRAFDACLGNGGYDPINDLSIYIISDGVVYDYQVIKASIIQHQAHRLKKGLESAAIGFIGVDVAPRFGLQIKNLIGKGIGSSESESQPPSTPQPQLQLPPKPQPPQPSPPLQYQADLGQLGYCRIEYIIEEEE
jgi:hypothetical protein